MDLATFLLARLAEDEQAALTATYCQEDAHEDVVNWHLDNEVQPAEVVGSDGLGIIQARTQHPGMLTHIARHDPARVLAEVEAKRELLEWHPTDPLGHCRCQEEDGIVYGQEPCPTKRLLALPYADHEQFEEVWRV